jgi:ribosome-associated heat shock protein Hsp15
MADEHMLDEDEPGRVRLDKWLWAARFFKTRSLAATAITGGKIDVNGERAKRARLLQIGDRVTVRRPPFVTELVVRGVSSRRGGASIATQLYEETGASRQAREGLAAQLRAMHSIHDMKGRPTKKDRRALERWREREE